MKIPSRFRRLDEILADLPMDDPWLLSELDGYLTGIAVCAETILPVEWLPPIWGGAYGEAAPFEDPIDVQLFADMVTARHGEILRELDRGKPKPIFDVEGRNGDVMWEVWIDGFAMAMELRPDAWSALDRQDAAETTGAVSSLQTLIDIARNETALTSIEINAICDTAPADIPILVTKLFAARARPVAMPTAPDDRAAKIGRNAPCPCGSGQKHKRCCGRD